MATAVRRRRGTTDQHQVFIGLVGEITVDTDKDTIVIHDGETTGGFPIAREDLSNVSSADITNTIGVGGLGRDKIAPGTADNVVINNGLGELSSEPQLAITRGGTGAGNIVDARNNLGLGTMATQNASFVNITGGSITGIDPISITSGGTSATNAADARTNLGAVNIAGDTITGNLRIGTGVGSIELGIDGGTGDDRILAYYSNGIKRWEVRVNAEPETGGNTGSDFRISRFDDLGSFIDAPFNIDREDGKITLGNAVEFSNSITFSAPISISQGGTGANNAADARTNLGLGTLAVQDSNSVAITGGSISGITPIAIADGGTGASTPSGARTNLGAVNIAGDTMTGDLTVGDTLESSAIIVTGEDGFIREFRLATLSSPRWSLGTDSSTETGSNAGSNFTITRSDDAGSAIDVPFSIARDTGDITLNADVNITGNTSLGGLTLDGILAINDGGTGADTAEGARVNLNVVNRSGDTMTGDLTVGSGIASSSIRVNGIGESIRSLSYLSEGFQRWSLITDATPEGAPSGVQYLKVTDPVQLPTGTGFGIAFAPTVSHLAVAHSSSPHVTIYEETGGVFNKLSDPAIEPPGSGLGVAFSPNSTYLAVTHLTSPRLTVYKRSGNTYTKLPDPADLPPDIAWKPAFSPDGNFLAVAHTTSPFVTIYQRSGDTLTKLPDPSTIPAGGANSVAFSPDSVHMAVAHAIAPWLTIYSISGTTFTKLPDPVNTPTGEGEGIAFSPNGLFMAVAHSNTPFVTIYSRSGDVFTKVADPAILPTDDAQSVAFSSNGSLFSVAHVASPFATNYVIDGTTFTKIADPATLPAGTGNGIGYASDSNFMAVAHVNSPFVTIYDVDEITPDIGSDFRIRRHDDQGVLIDSLVTIERSTGDTTISGNSTFTQDLTVNGTVTFDIPLSVSSGGTGANNPADARTNLGLGSISTQDASSVSITGGSITGITDLAIADGGTGASTAADARANLGAVNIAGDTMTGNLIVGDGTGTFAVSADGGAGFTRAFNLRTNSLSRWSILATSDPESGGNVGSDFTITRNDDAGAFINAPITILRGSGNVSIDATTTSISGNVTTGGGVGQSSITVDGGAGFSRSLAFSTGGVQRWTLTVTGEAETGSNLGSNFQLNRYDDAGVLLDTPISILRSNGIISFTNLSVTDTLSGGEAAGDDLTLTSTINATKGSIELGSQSAYDEQNARLGIGTQTPAVELDVVGGVKFTQGFRVGRTTTATDYTTTVSDYIIGVTDLSTARIITLVSAVTIGAGGSQIIKDESGAAGGANNITIVGAGSQTIDGQASVIITANYGVVRLYSDGSNWFSI